MTTQEYNELSNREFRLPVLNDKFTVSHKLLDRDYAYELIGFDNEDSNRYFQLKDTDSGHVIGVDNIWFNVYLTGRKITWHTKEIASTQGYLDFISNE